jgi:hypothetical protein
MTVYLFFICKTLNNKEEASKIRRDYEEKYSDFN